MIGQLLVAPPAQKNEFWEQTVIFIYEQSSVANTVGLIVNKPSDRTLSDLAEHHDIKYTGDELLYIGGPVNPSALVMLHTDDWVCSNTMHVGGQWRISSDRSMLSRVCSGDAPRRWRLFLGMSVWTPMQLEGEMRGDPPWNKKTAWVTAPASEPILFSKSPERAWKKSIDSAAHEMVSSYFTID